MHIKLIQKALSNKRLPVRWLGERLGITSSAIFQWREVPAERVLEVERHLGVSRHDLRPDLYPRD